jgi:hypothetical protein
MAEEQQNQCQNPPCTCPPQPDGKYCSASCEGAANPGWWGTHGTIEIDCDCGHEACQGNF